MKKRNIIITGAGRGIGKAIALEFAQPNNHLILTWNNDKDSANETADIIRKKNATVELHQICLEDSKSISDFCNSFNNKNMPDILVNNAAITQKKDFLDLTSQDWDRLLFANLRAPFQLCQAVIPSMKKKGWGRIVNISSIGGQWGGIHQVHYAASKAAIINLTRSLAKLYSKDGIVSTAIAPGVIDTQMIRESLGHMPESLISQIPSGRLGTVEEVARAVKYLCSCDAAYLSGTTLNINGGMYFNS